MSEARRKFYERWQQEYWAKVREQGSILCRRYGHDWCINTARPTEHRCMRCGESEPLEGRIESCRQSPAEVEP